MITLIHLLDHLGLPSGAAIVIVIAGRKFLKGGIARTVTRREGDQRSSRHYR